MLKSFITATIAVFTSLSVRSDIRQVRALPIFFVTGYLFLLPLLAVSQRTVLSEAEQSGKIIRIIWQQPEEYQIGEREFFRRMIFDQAVFPYDQRLPVWHHLYRHGNPQTRLEARIIPVETSPVPASEVHLLPDEGVTSDFLVEVHPAVMRRENNSSVLVLPIRKTSQGGYERLISFRIEYKEVTDQHPSASFRSVKSTSLLTTGDWYRLRVSRSGIYRIDYSQLADMGLAGAGSSRIGIYGMGGRMLPEHAGAIRPDGLQPIALLVEDGGDNSIDPGDYILFYAEGPGAWDYDPVNDRFNHQPHLYDEFNNYYITRGDAPGLRIQAQPPPSGSVTHQVTTYRDFFRHEKDSLSLLKSGKLWLGEVFDHRTTYQFSFPVTNINPLAPVEILTSVAARSLTPSSFTISSGQHSTSVSVIQVTSGYNNVYAHVTQRVLSFSTSANEIPLTITYSKPLSSSVGWLDYIQINLSRELRFTGGQFRFRQPNVTGASHIARYQIGQSTAQTRVWDITDPFVPELVQGTLAGSVYSFDADAQQLREYAAHNGTGWLSAETVGKITNQDLRSVPQTEMVIVAHPLFLPAANRLADIHRTQTGLSVLVVTPGEIYHEFSAGKQDPTAIRDFMKMLYDRATTPKELPRYLLLFGDGSYDPKNRIENNTNFIPTFQSIESLDPAGSWVTDDYFGVLDNHEGFNANGALDIGIGRIPVGTLAEANQMVDKIVRYISDNTEVPDIDVCAGQGNRKPLADWRNTICIVADDEDSNLHIDQAEMLANYLDTTHTVYNINKLYLDAYQQVSISGGHRYPDVNEAINRQVELGALIMNYIGHGGELGWAHERVLRIEDILSWQNTWHLPLFMTSTCEFSRFDDPGRRSAGEYTYLHPNGGAIALFTTTRLAFASTNYAFNTAFYNHVFNKVNGDYQRLGDIFRIAKVSSGSVSSNRNMVILGDPALMLAYPRHSVITTHVNDSLVTNPFDTLKALSRVTIRGAVTDGNQQVLQHFNGTLYPIVLDKKSTFTTLANDQGSFPRNFNMQKNVLYKGKVSVTNGLFSFSFYVPKDIAYAYGFGKISYYAENGTEDAHGYFDRIVVGGTSDVPITDQQGPEIRLYMNDTSFVFGGTTDANPVLLAILNDTYGINTTGSGIGHDITAVLNGDNSNPIVLNDFYESDLDSYNSGRVIYRLNDLKDGEHRMSLKAWDILNNSSEAYTEFIVASADEPILSHVLNYPNPFTTYTEFWFEHNQPCCDLDVMIQVFTVSGRLVKTIRETVTTTGYRAAPVPWDGLDEFGDRLARGVYVYKVSIRTQDMKQAEKYEKLVILR
jgi:hypothetical protein